MYSTEEKRNESNRKTRKRRTFLNRKYISIVRNERRLTSINPSKSNEKEIRGENLNYLVSVNTSLMNNQYIFRWIFVIILFSLFASGSIRSTACNRFIAMRSGCDVDIISTHHANDTIEILFSHAFELFKCNNVYCDFYSYIYTFLCLVILYIEFDSPLQLINLFIRL